MDDDLKRRILVHDGIISEGENQKKLLVLTCPRCSLINAIENKYCSKCSYPLVPSAFEEIKEEENMKIQSIEEKYKRDMKEYDNSSFKAYLELVPQNHLNHIY